MVPYMIGVPQPPFSCRRRCGGVCARRRSCDAPSRWPRSGGSFRTRGRDMQALGVSSLTVMLPLPDLERQLELEVSFETFMHDPTAARSAKHPRPSAPVSKAKPTRRGAIEDAPTSHRQQRSWLLDRTARSEGLASCGNPADFPHLGDDHPITVFLWCCCRGDCRRWLGHGKCFAIKRSPAGAGRAGYKPGLRPHRTDARPYENPDRKPARRALPGDLRISSTAYRSARARV